MQARLSYVTLGVANLARSSQFYREVMGLSQIAVPEHAGFMLFDLGQTRLALYPRAALAEDAGVTDSPPASFPGFTLSHNVSSRDEVDLLLQDLAEKGAVIARVADDAFWGGRSGYFRDPDGYLWEIAWNPDLPLG